MQNEAHLIGLGSGRKDSVNAAERFHGLVQDVGHLVLEALSGLFG
jgi:hypothetical protein